MNCAFHSPSTILAGAQSRTRKRGLLKDRGLRRPLLVTDPYIAAQPFFGELGENLAQAGLCFDIFHDVQPDPTDANVCAGLERFRGVGADSIVAVGGGSALDAAKIIGAAAANAMELPQMQGYERIPNAGPPLVAVPTTAGTGRGATKVAVITDTSRFVKMMILDPKLMPSLAILDYELTMSMPADLTAHVGVDTLTHGIEAYVSRKAAPLPEPIALSCINLVARHVAAAWSQPGDRAARHEHSRAAGRHGVHQLQRLPGARDEPTHRRRVPPATRPFERRAAARSDALLDRRRPRAIRRGKPDARLVRARRLGGRGVPQTRRRIGAPERRLRIPRLGECLAGKEAEFRSLVPLMAADALASGGPANNPVVPIAEQIVDLYLAAW